MVGDRTRLKTSIFRLCFLVPEPSCWYSFICCTIIFVNLCLLRSAFALSLEELQTQTLGYCHPHSAASPLVSITLWRWIVTDSEVCPGPNHVLYVCLIMTLYSPLGSGRQQSGGIQFVYSHHNGSDSSFQGSDGRRRDQRQSPPEPMGGYSQYPAVPIVPRGSGRHPKCHHSGDAGAPPLKRRPGRPRKDANGGGAVIEFGSLVSTINSLKPYLMS